jgi:hypothetical protein
MYYELYNYAKSGADSEWDAFHWVSADILPASEIESARRTLSEEMFQQEMEGSFITFSGRAYHSFDARTHCAPLHHLYNDRAPLIIAMDFNVSPGSSVIAQEMWLPSMCEGTGVIGEVAIPRHSTTPAVCRKIAQDWGSHRGPVYVYGDATGGSAGSSRIAGSDWDIVKAELQPVYGNRLSLRVPPANPRERVRVNAVNSRLKSAAGDIRLMVDPVKAPHVVRDLEGVRLLEGGSGEIDKKADPHLTHWVDGLGYYISREFPIVAREMREGRMIIG